MIAIGRAELRYVSNRIELRNDFEKEFGVRDKTLNTKLNVFICCSVPCGKGGNTPVASVIYEYLYIQCLFSYYIEQIISNDSTDFLNRIEHLYIIYLRDISCLKFGHNMYHISDFFNNIRKIIQDLQKFM